FPPLIKDLARSGTSARRPALRSSMPASRRVRSSGFSRSMSSLFIFASRAAAASGDSVESSPNGLSTSPYARPTPPAASEQRTRRKQSLRTIIEPLPYAHAGRCQLTIPCYDEQKFYDL